MVKLLHSEVRSKEVRGEGCLLLSELDRHYRAPLQKFFRRRGCTAAMAQDLTQEVFVRTISYQRSRAIENPKSFIFQAAANLLRDVARSTKRWNVSSLEKAAKASGDSRALIDAITPERIIEGRQDLQALSDAFGALDARTQRIFVLNRIEQLRHKDIADHLGLSVSLIEKALRGAQRHLEAEYAGVLSGAAR